jgi:choline kinase
MTTLSSSSVLFLAAGIGQRISDVTDAPKCLLDLEGHSLLERHLMALKPLGIKHVYIVVGYKQECIKEHLQPYQNDFTFHFIDNPDFIAKGNTYSLLLGLQAITQPGPVTIFDADLFYHPDILKDFLQDTGEDLILVGEASLEDIECAKTLVDQDRWVRKCVDKRLVTTEELQQYSFVGEAIGVLKFSTALIQELKKSCELFLQQEQNLRLNWEHVMNVFLLEHQMKAYKTSSSLWIEIDNAQDYQEAKNIFWRMNKGYEYDEDQYSQPMDQ